MEDLMQRKRRETDALKRDRQIVRRAERDWSGEGNSVSTIMDVMLKEITDKILQNNVFSKKHQK